MNLPRGWGEARFGASSWRWSVRPVPEYRSRESAAAECLLRGACVLHAEPERRALLRRAEHVRGLDVDPVLAETIRGPGRSEEHTSELQSRVDIVCRLLLEKKKLNTYHI